MRNSFESPAEEYKSPENSEHKDATRPRKKFFSRLRNRFLAGGLLAAGSLAAQDKPKEQLIIMPPFVKAGQTKQKPPSQESPAERIVRLEKLMNSIRGGPAETEDEATTSTPKSEPESSTPRAESPASPESPREIPRKSLSDFQKELSAHKVNPDYPGRALKREAEALERMAQSILSQAEKEKENAKKNLDTTEADLKKAEESINKNAHGVKTPVHGVSLASSGKAEIKRARVEIKKEYEKTLNDIEVRVTLANMAIVDAKLAQVVGVRRSGGEALDRTMEGKK